MTDDPQGAHVPVPRGELIALQERVETLGAALAKHRTALSQLIELADDLRADAVRGLRDRGASAAQVARYEEAFGAARREAQRTLVAAEDDTTALGGAAASLS